MRGVAIMTHQERRRRKETETGLSHVIKTLNPHEKTKKSFSELTMEEQWDDKITISFA